MTKVLILLGSQSDLPATQAGLDLLREMDISFNLRIASAHRTPEHVDTLIKDFQAQGGSIIICLAGMSAHLAGVAASLTTLPVLAVPIPGSTTAGFDALLSMVNMPAGIPVATMGMGKSGFTNACLFSAQSLGLSDKNTATLVAQDRARRTAKVLEADAEYQVMS